MKRFVLVVCAFACGLVAHAGELSPGDKDFLAHYENVHAALAADDLPAARKAAGNFAEGKKIAADDNIAAARADFAVLSQRAIALAQGVQGFYVLRCPMANKDWVQTSSEVSNPYMGREMATCGVVRPHTPSP